MNLSARALVDGTERDGRRMPWLRSGHRILQNLLQEQ